MVTDENFEKGLIDWAWQLIIPDEAKKRFLCDGGKVLIHNTSPNNAKNILRNPELWLMNARAMRDEQEVKLGRDCVDRFLKYRSDEISACLNTIIPNLWEDISTCWNSEREPQIDQTYIACFSDAPDSDFIGSERHWDEYGNIAFHFDPAFMRNDAPELALYVVKVVYGKNVIDQGLSDFLINLKRHHDRLKTVPRDALASIIRHRLFFTSVASKDAAFAWEKEWRLIHNPFLFSSADVQKEIVGEGEQQRPIYPLSLQNTLDGNNPTLGVPNLIRNIVIRPTGGSADQELRYDLIRMLKYHGVLDAADRVIFSKST